MQSRPAPSGHPEYLAQQRFGSLDGLRAISILAVIWHHTAPAGVAEPWASLGPYGVMLFFAISGYLITTLLLRERASSGNIDLGAFYLRRVLRIFPMYYGTLAVYVVLVAMVEKDMEVAQAFWRNLPYFASFTSNLFVPLDGRVIFYFAWSVAAEEQFYLVWPWVLRRLQKVQPALITMGVFCAALLLANGLGIQTTPPLSLSIAGGVLMALALHTHQGYRLLAQLLGTPWAAPLVLLAMVLSLAALPDANLVMQVLCVLLVGACVLQERHALATVLHNRALAYLGTISYGIYMLHMLCKNVVVKLLALAHLPSEGWHLFALTLLLSSGVAALSHRYFEAYFLRLKPHKHRSLSAPSTPTPSANP